MHSTFYKEVLDLVLEWKEPFESEGSVIYFRRKAIAVHLVRLADYSNNPYWFRELSDAYERQGIQMVHLWEDHWNNRQCVIISRLRSLLGHFIRIHARKTVVKTMDKPALDVFLEKNHLHGSPQAKYKYGLFYHNELVSAASFSAGRPIPRNGIVYHSYEMIRFANLSGYVVAGGLSKLMAQFIADLQPDDIMSYADRDWSLGRSYEKMGFHLAGTTDPQLFYIHPEEQIRYYAQRLPEGVTETELMRRGYFRIYNAGNKKYVKLIKRL